MKRRFTTRQRHLTAKHMKLGRKYLHTLISSSYGDPHINYYEGTAFYDDVKLYLPKK